MNLHRINCRFATQGFLSAKAAVVLAILVGGAGLLTYEWQHLHSATTQQNSAGSLGHKEHEAITTPNK